VRYPDSAMGLGMLRRDNNANSVRSAVSTLYLRKPLLKAVTEGLSHWDYILCFEPYDVQSSEVHRSQSHCSILYKCDISLHDRMRAPLLPSTISR